MRSSQFGSMHSPCLSNWIGIVRSGWREANSPAHVLPPRRGPCRDRTPRRKRCPPSHGCHCASRDGTRPWECRSARQPAPHFIGDRPWGTANKDNAGQARAQEGWRVPDLPKPLLPPERAAPRLGMECCDGVQFRGVPEEQATRPTAALPSAPPSSDRSLGAAAGFTACSGRGRAAALGVRAWPRRHECRRGRHSIRRNRADRACRHHRDRRPRGADRDG